MRLHPNSYTVDFEDEEYEPQPEVKISKPRHLGSILDTDDEAILGEMPGEPRFTYQASRHEKVWMMDALRGFFDNHEILDVLHQVRGGKEANVYCCAANPSLGVELIAAKIYRPRMFRSLKNDSLYKVGRPVLDQDGKAVHDQRSQRAIAKKTRIGARMQITSWIEHEYQALQVLHSAGADVPRPVSQERNTILMEYIGEAHHPAPSLNSLMLSTAEARRLFDRLIENIRIMLSKNIIHADLSAYNVLYFNGNPTIIDFPQVVDPLLNPEGFALLERDVERICQYFSRYHISVDHIQLAASLWEEYIGGVP